MASGHPPLSDYAPRQAFLGLHGRCERWAIVVAHRRAGKTIACINELIKAASTCTLPSPRFAYVAPQLNRAKDIAWDHLLRHTDCFGGERMVNQSELWVELPGNRARIRLYGADNPDRLRGLSLDGVVLDEFGDMEPEVWTSAVRPGLSDRSGWAILIGTPRGRNHFHDLWTAAADDPGWYRLRLKASETRLLGEGELADMRRTMSDEEYAQEYECSFEAAVRGAYWGKAMADIEAQGRIGRVPHEPTLQVHTAWDLGMADSTVIWLIQTERGGGQIRIIDLIKGEGEPLSWYAAELARRPAEHGAVGNWVWGRHYLPHDAQVRELGTGKSRLEILQELGIPAFLCRSLPIEDGIQAVRSLLPNCWFDAGRCHSGIEALRMYRREYDDRGQEYKRRPVHDWTSHYADALRYFAVEHKPAETGLVYVQRIRKKRSYGWVA